MDTPGQSALPALFASARTGPRCVKAKVPNIEQFDVSEHDGPLLRRHKWALRAMFIRLADCTSGGPECQRCSQNFLDAVYEPMGPWSPCVGQNNCRYQTSELAIAEGCRQQCQLSTR